MPHRDAFAQRRAERSDEIVQVGDDLVAQHEAVRVRPAIGKARQLALPVRRDQAERIPALGAPGVAGALLLEHDVIDAALRQIPADREAGLAAADRRRPNGARRELIVVHVRSVSLESVDGDARVGRSAKRLAAGLDARELGHARERAGTPYFALTRSLAMLSAVRLRVEEIGERDSSRPARKNP